MGGAHTPFWGAPNWGKRWRLEQSLTNWSRKIPRVLNLLPIVEDPNSESGSPNPPILLGPPTDALSFDRITPEGCIEGYSMFSDLSGQGGLLIVCANDVEGLCRERTSCIKP